MTTDDIKEELLKVCAHYTDEERAQVEMAYNTTATALAGKYRENGDPFIRHAVNVAIIVAKEIALMSTSVIATLLHEATRETSVIAEIRKTYGETVAGLVDGLNKISTIKPQNTNLQAENLRRLIVSYSKDPRVTLIKLADRLEVMRSLDIFPKSKQVKKATETLLLYAPLAHQLGLYNIKTELEDRSLSYTEPEAYRGIANKIKTAVHENDKLMSLFIKPIEEGLKELGINYYLKSRTKSVYSVWRKMQIQKIDFESIHDIYAIRIITDVPLEKEQEVCWQIYSLVTDLYTPNTKRLRDWISAPKKSGYESLHITVFDALAREVEVQIRTTRMDEAAERGTAAHWKYKGGKQEQQLEQWLDKVRELLEKPDSETRDYFSTFKLDEIFVFTPTGDLRRLPAGATVLDFAFDIHSNIGIKCVGAKVNQRNVPIKEALKTGDVVEVLTAKNQKPSADWLNFLVLSKAKAKVRQVLREEEVKSAKDGKEILDRRLKNWKLEVGGEELGLLIKKYKCKTISEFYDKISDQEIDLQDIKNSLIGWRAEKEAEYTPLKAEASKAETTSKSQDYLVLGDDLKQVSHKLSKCCNPIFGDDVFGFVSVADGVKIHRYSCPNAQRLIENYPYRIMKVKWVQTDKTNSFQVTLRISGSDEIGVSHQITEAVEALKINLRSIDFHARNGLFECKLQLSVSTQNALSMLTHQLKRIRGIQRISRS